MAATRFLIIIIAAAIALIGEAQNLSRRVPPAPRAAKVPEAAPAIAPSDTLRGAECDSVVVAGFDKPLRAVRETMFVSNHTHRPIDGICLEITYSDTRGRMLHKAVHNISCDIPPGETRRVEVRSFDRVGLFHYRLSPVPNRATQATPFDVAVTIKHILTPQNPK